MEHLRLALVESCIDSYEGPSLENVKIIGVQHILETTHAMFRSLYRLGLKPENVSLIGKCYSTCQEVYEEMLADGIDVSSGSTAYNSHQSYDNLFAEEVKSFLLDHIPDLSSGRYEQIIVLDDGGKCINFINDYLTHLPPVFAIEQTSSGYEAIKNSHLRLPVINVARSPIKLTLESPMIAEAAAERLYQSLERKELFPKEALIIGGGAIGNAMSRRLSSKMNITIFDKNKSLNNTGSLELPQIIPSFSLIIGCTGKTSISHDLHPNISPGTSLVSVSSSDREFDAVHLRKQIDKNNNCHEDLLIHDVLLVRSGFPVNFDGERENIDPELIQLTIALITSGILQARTSRLGISNGIHPLDPKAEHKIETEFLNSRTQLI